MRIANTVQDSIVDGPGLRYVVFVQGCSHNCPGCHNPETHDPDGGRDVSVLNLVEEMLENPLCEGLTISGGEPFDQVWDCVSLADLARRRGKTVWTYTGYTWEQIRTLRMYRPGWSFLLALTNVLVDGPFVESLKSYEAKFRGSTNQRLIDVKKSLETGKIVLWEDKRGREIGFDIPES